MSTTLDRPTYAGLAFEAETFPPRPVPSEKAMYLIIGGAFTTRAREHAPSELFNLMSWMEWGSAGHTRGIYSELGTVLVEGKLQDSLIVPDMGNVPGTFVATRNYERIYADGRDEIDEYLGNRSGPFHLIGHSIGGNIALQYAHENPDLVESVTTLGTPYLGIDEALDQLYTHLNPELIQSTQETMARRDELGLRAPRLRAIATRGDEIVSLASATTPMADSNVVLVSRGNIARQNPNFDIRRVSNVPGHWDLPRHPDAIELCRQAIQIRLESRGLEPR